MQTLNLSSNRWAPYRGQVTIGGSRQLEASMPTFHLDSAFAVNLLTAKLRILWRCVEERIV